MAGLIEGADRAQAAPFPHRLDERIEKTARSGSSLSIVAELDLRGLGFARVVPGRTGRPCYHPAVQLKLLVHGCPNRIPSSRRLERDPGAMPNRCGGPAHAPGDRTIADFRRDNGLAVWVFAPGLSNSAAGSACRRAAASRSAAVSSKRSTTVTATSPRAGPPVAYYGSTFS